MGNYKREVFSAFLLSILVSSNCKNEGKEFGKLLQLRSADKFFSAEENRARAQNGLLLPNVGVKFSCNITALRAVQDITKPKSVHKLRPCDVDVVAAMGDSLTAARAAKSANLITIFDQFRGMSFSIGGDGETETTATLPNILKTFNSKLKGFSRAIGNEKSLNAHMNVGVSGAKSSDMISQARRLVVKLKEDKSIDYNNDWKVLTILSAPTICVTFVNHHDIALRDMLRISKSFRLSSQRGPRMFVNVLPGVDVSRINKFKSFTCDLVHALVCSCAKDAKEEVSNAAKEYTRLVQELIKSKRYDSREDFTVVLQPFIEESILPVNTEDKTFIAPDCFHFSVNAHAIAAQSLWKNMLQPVGKKSTSWNIEQDFIDCPTHPEQYFYTQLNSQTIPENIIIKNSTKPLTLDKSSPAMSSGAVAVIVIYALFGTATIIMGIFGILAFMKRKRYRDAQMEKLCNPYHGFVDT